MFNKHRSQIEKHIASVTNDANQALEMKRSKTSIFAASKEDLNRNLEFHACPDHNQFQNIVKFSCFYFVSGD